MTPWPTWKELCALARADTPKEWKARCEFWAGEVDEGRVAMTDADIASTQKQYVINTTGAPGDELPIWSSPMDGWKIDPWEKDPKTRIGLLLSSIIVAGRSISQADDYDSRQLIKTGVFWSYGDLGLLDQYIAHPMPCGAWFEILELASPRGINKALVVKMLDVQKERVGKEVIDWCLRPEFGAARVRKNLLPNIGLTAVLGAWTDVHAKCVSWVKPVLTPEVRQRIRSQVLIPLDKILTTKEWQTLDKAQQAKLLGHPEKSVREAVWKIIGKHKAKTNDKQGNMGRKAGVVR